MANAAPNSFYLNALSGNIDLTTGVWKTALFPSTWTLDIDNDDVWADISADEVTGTNYTAGGLTTTLTLTQDDTDNRAELTATAIVFSNVTIADYRYAVLYQDSGGGAQYIAIAFDFGSAKSVTAQDLTVNWPNDVFRLATA